MGKLSYWEWALTLIGAIAVVGVHVHLYGETAPPTVAVALVGTSIVLLALTNWLWNAQVRTIFETTRRAQRQHVIDGANDAIWDVEAMDLPDDEKEALFEEIHAEVHRLLDDGGEV